MKYRIFNWKYFHTNYFKGYGSFLGLKLHGVYKHMVHVKKERSLTTCHFHLKMYFACGFTTKFGSLPWRLKTPASQMFTQVFTQAQIKENIIAPRHAPLCGEFTGDRWIHRTKGQLRGKCFHLMTSSCGGGRMHTHRTRAHIHRDRWSSAARLLALHGYVHTQMRDHRLMRLT